jgi:hypothetical protein
MTDLRTLDIYDAAYLSGGPNRVVDTALVALIETGRVRTQSDGTLSVVQDTARHDVEAAVLDGIGTGSWRNIDMVRWRAGRDERVVALAERLRRGGLLCSEGLARLRGFLGQPGSLTTAGRRALRELRAQPPARGVAPGTSVARVAFDGPAQLPDVELRNAVFFPPVQRRVRRRRRRTGFGTGTSGAGYGSGWLEASCAGGASCGGGGGAGCGGGG